MKCTNIVLVALLVFVTQARAQSSSTISAPAKPADQYDENEESQRTVEAEEFSGTDNESGPGFRIWGRSWSPSAFSVASVETDEMGSGGRLSTYSYLTFGTSVADNLRFKIRLPVVYNSAGTDRFDGAKQNPDQWILQDIILELSSSNFLLLPFDTGIYWEGRVYLPTSQSSRAAQTIAHFRNDVILDKIFNRTFAMEFEGHYGYYYQSRRSYPITFQDEYGFDTSATSLTKRWDVDQWTTLWGKINQSFAIGAEAGMEQTNYNQSPAEQKSKQDLRQWKVGPNLRYQTGGGNRFILAYLDTVDRDSNEQELGRFLTRNTQLSLLSWIGF